MKEIKKTEEKRKKKSNILLQTITQLAVVWGVYIMIYLTAGSTIRAEAGFALGYLGSAITLTRKILCFLIIFSGLVEAFSRKNKNTKEEDKKK